MAKDLNISTRTGFRPDTEKEKETISRRPSDIKDLKATEKVIPVSRRFTKKGIHPYDEMDWELRSASITNDRGEVIFEQKDVEVPKQWSQTATNVVVSKYFRGGVGQVGREHSVRQLVDRVAKTIGRWSRTQNYLACEEDAETFEAELTYLLVHQLACFNSPVWFNMGIEEKPQCSACFINSVEDRMDSILELAKTEGMLFKYGSGTGTNLSPLRSSRERLSTGGWASGPVSFMKGYDAFAGVIKSGGKTRRAAKMQILDITHPDIVDFIEAKPREEKKAWALIDAGYDGSVNGDAYSSVFFQNANFSVRVTDEFMRAVEENGEWTTRAVTTGQAVETYRARDLLRKIAEGAHLCGDPGLQYDTTINEWHTCAVTDRIYASNPCSEYMFLDNSACNLASLNLMKFRRPDGEFDVDAFRHAVHVMIVAMEVIVGNASYPTPKIDRNSHDFRPLGLGYANLGAILMARGLPYDSDEGRAYAGAVTALMCGQAYLSSAQVASRVGPFARFEENRRPFFKVIRKHRKAVEDIEGVYVPKDLLEGARDAWEQALQHGLESGYRNSQVTVLAPTGTIAFMMDCDTTGIEPDIALIKYKKLVGGGMLKIVNHTVPEALRKLGYQAEQVKEVLAYLNEKETIEGAPHLRSDHLPVFDCAFRPRNGMRSIHYKGHVRMMAATQPFLSGAISKTVNLPESVTVEEIEQVYLEGWKLGLKAIAVYRDNCKRSQPLNTGLDSEKAKAEAKPVRRRLPDERKSITHKFSISGYEGYITVGMYDDGAPGEIFVTMAKQGSTVSGLVDTVATATSIALQYGVPLEVLVRKFSHTRFEPAGLTHNKDIPIAKSIIDYIFRWLGLKFLPPEKQPAATDVPAVNGEDDPGGGSSKPAFRADSAAGLRSTFQTEADAPACHECGTIMVRNGACYKCLNCGSTSGCS
ncbi:MAG: vitamin B12-dependent ribonucleotide reductase [Planctomycetes bacterium]|nr:vitamin B12-dependent ribonucleotide reductase [Planctomycetota bacterium]